MAHGCHELQHNESIQLICPQVIHNTCTAVTSNLEVTMGTAVLPATYTTQVSNIKGTLRFEIDEPARIMASPICLLFEYRIPDKFKPDNKNSESENPISGIQKTHPDLYVALLEALVIR